MSSKKKKWMSRDYVGDLVYWLMSLLPPEVLGFLGGEPAREMLCVPGRKFRHDIAWDLGEGHLLAVEVEGDVWHQGRHTRGSGYRGDCMKYNLSASFGNTIFRITTSGIPDPERFPVPEMWLAKALDAPHVDSEELWKMWHEKLRYELPPKWSESKDNELLILCWSIVNFVLRLKGG